MCDVIDEDPKFGQIIDIFETPAAETLFVMRELITVSFNQHFHAYEVISTSSFFVYQYHQFKDHHPLHMCNSFGSNPCYRLIVMKYHVFNTQDVSSS